MLRILIADDEKNMRITLAAILKREGYEVETAASGEEALDRCQEQRFDVVLLDVRLPGMDGVEVFRRLRRECEGTRVILMSAYSIDTLRRQALDEGAAAFLAKPLDLQQVIHLIKDVGDHSVLIVGDGTEEIHQLHDALAAQGYYVTVTDSPHNALELVEQIKFHVVLIDALLPTMTGLEFYLALKAVTPTTVAIMMAGMDGEAERIAREAVRQTAYTVLEKPIDLNRLFSLFRTVIGQQASGEIRKPRRE